MSYLPFETVVLIYTVVNLVCLLYIVACVKETVRAPSSAQSSHIISRQSVRDIWCLVASPRRDRNRLDVLLVLGLDAALSIASAGSTAVLKPFLHSTFQWSLTECMFFLAVQKYATHATIGVLLPLGLLVLRWHVTSIAIVGVAFQLVSLAALAFAHFIRDVYVSVSLGLPGGVIAWVVPAISSRLVERDEQARIFSLIACINTGVPTLAMPLAAATFRATRKHWPGAWFALAAVLYLMPLAVLMVLRRRQAAAAIDDGCSGERKPLLAA